MRFTRSSPSLAVSGIIAPGVFVAGWSLLGRTVPHYSPARDAISELARLGQPTHSAMSLVFVTYSGAIAVYSVPLTRLLGKNVGAAAFVSGLGTLGVASAPLGTAFTDRLHVVFAAISYVAVAGGPLLAVGKLNSRPAKLAAAVTGVTSAAALVASVVGPTNTTGLFQRLGLTVGDVWFVATAIIILTKRDARLSDNTEPRLS